MSGRKRVHVKDEGKSSSGKLRRVAAYLFYSTDPPETSLEGFFPEISEHRKITDFGSSKWASWGGSETSKKHNIKAKKNPGER